MARRRGKAAARRARQRTPRRHAVLRPAPPPAPGPTSTRPSTEEEPAAPAAGAPSRLEADRPPAVPARLATAAGPSGLSERARGEYHYVGRDLRNIAILGTLMALLLFGAWLAFAVLRLSAG